MQASVSLHHGLVGRALAPSAARLPLLDLQGHLGEHHHVEGPVLVVGGRLLHLLLHNRALREVPQLA